MLGIGSTCRRGHKMTERNAVPYKNRNGKIQYKCKQCADIAYHERAVRLGVRAPVGIKEYKNYRKCATCGTWKLARACFDKRNDGTYKSQCRECLKDYSGEGYIKTQMIFILNRIEFAHQRGYSYRKIARIIGAHETQIHRWKNGLATKKHVIDRVCPILLSNPIFQEDKE